METPRDHQIEKNGPSTPFSEWMAEIEREFGPIIGRDIRAAYKELWAEYMEPDEAHALMTRR
jgi:hypothetical protein